MRVTFIWVMALAVLLGPEIGRADVFGFKDWKTLRVEEAKATFDRLRLESQAEAAGRILLERPKSHGVRRSPPTPVGDTPVPSHAPVGNGRSRLAKNSKTHQRLAQAELNVEIAQELSVNDYFMLYLSQFKTQAAFLEAARKMTPEEFAELMIAYKKQLSNTEQMRDSEPASLAAETRTGSVSQPSGLDL